MRVYSIINENRFSMTSMLHFHGLLLGISILTYCQGKARAVRVLSFAYANFLLYLSPSNIIIFYIRIDSLVCTYKTKLSVRQQPREHSEKRMHPARETSLHPDVL
jgi:hypothetical protein